jgi:hypothetical protein
MRGKILGRMEVLLTTLKGRERGRVELRSWLLLYHILRVLVCGLQVSKGIKQSSCLFQSTRCKPLGKWRFRFLFLSWATRSRNCSSKNREGASTQSCRRLAAREQAAAPLPKHRPLKAGCKSGSRPAPPDRKDTKVVEESKILDLFLFFPHNVHGIHIRVSEQALHCLFRSMRPLARSMIA